MRRKKRRSLEDADISNQEGTLLFPARVRPVALPGRWVFKEVHGPHGVLWTMQIPGFPSRPATSDCPGGKFREILTGPSVDSDAS